MDPYTDLEKAAPSRAHTWHVRGAENDGRVRSRNGNHGDGRPRRLPSAFRPRSASTGRYWTPGRARRVHLDAKDPGHWAINHHLENLISEVEPHRGILERLGILWLRPLSNERYDERRRPVSRPAENERRFRISLAEMQRMRLRKLQCQIVEDVIHMRVHGTEPDKWEDTLDRYIKALQDHDYMESCAKRQRDPFLVTGEYAIDNYVFKRLLQPYPGLLGRDIGRVSSRYRWEARDKTTAICGTRGENQKTIWLLRFQRRVALGAIGGVFLVGPMWLMVLHNTLYTCLISTTVLVTVFGLTMAYYLEGDNNVLASTAAYAAVLVVFVGSSVSNTLER